MSFLLAISLTFASNVGQSGEYPFRVDARDGDFGGGNQADRFTIKIWAPGTNPNTNQPIYKASGDLETGSIKIHI